MVRIAMRLALKSLLYALLGSLLLLQPVTGMGSMPPGGEAERALMRWLGGPVAFCLPGGADPSGEGPMRDGHPCCLPPLARSPVLLPDAPRVPPPRLSVAHLSGEAPAGTAEVRQPPVGPQQPRAPPRVT